MVPPFARSLARAPVPTSPPRRRGDLMSAKYLLYTALISLATTVAYEHYKGSKA